MFIIDKDDNFWKFPRNQSTFFFKLWLCWVFVTVQAFSSCCEWGVTLCCGVWASHCSGFSCLEYVFSSRGLQAQLLCGMWSLPGPGIKPMCPALADGFLSTVPPGKSQNGLHFVGLHFVSLFHSLLLVNFLLSGNHQVFPLCPF